MSSEIQKLHTSIRRYCMNRYSYWTKRYGELVSAGKDRAGYDRFCTDSAPFYRRLMKDQGDTRLVALFPQENGEGERHLSNLGIKVDEVEQAAFVDLGISGTPTLILVDSGGKVIKKWEGALPPTSESEVIGQLNEEIAGNQ